MSILSASIAEVKIGIISIEGLMDEKGEYAVAVPQIAILFPYFQDSHNQASQKLKRLMGIGFKTTKVKTEFNRNVTLAVSLNDFKKVLRKLDKINDPIAVELTDVLIDLSLHQLFCDAFGIKCEAEERQQWLFARMGSKDAFWQLGEGIEIYKPKHPERSDSYRKFLYSNCQDRVNRGLFGKPAKTIREELGVADGILIRDYYNRIALSRIDKIQELASVQIIHKDIEPQDAVKFALDNYRYERMHYGK